MVEVSNLVKTFKRSDGTPITAVKGISFDISRGEIFSLLGPNGAGKTTTISMRFQTMLMDHLCFSLSFIPESAQVIRNGSQALSPGRKWVVLDMAWPDGWPLWLRHGLFFLSSWGITGDVIQRRPWQTVWQTIEQNLVEVERKQFWRGFFYLASGTRPG